MEKNISIKLGDLLKGTVFSSQDMLNDTIITGIKADSRKTKAGDLFVAVKGESTDGHSFIKAAVKNGCSAILLEKGRSVPKYPGITRIEVEDSKAVLGQLAARFYGNPARRLKMIAITGTNGKTTATYLMESILMDAGFRPGIIGTVNYRYSRRDGSTVELPAPLTTPDALALQRLIRTMADEGVTHVVMEVSSHALAQKRLAGIFFDVAVFTNLSRDHLDFHGDMTHYFASKKKLFMDHLKPDGRAVIMTEATGKEHWGEKLAKELASGTSGRKREVVTCGLASANTVHPGQFSFDINGIDAEIITGQGAFQMHSPLAGDFNVKNLLAATGIGLALNLAQDSIRKGLEKTSLIPGRLERIMPQEPGSKGPAIFVDYAHTPDALANVLTTLRKLSPGRLICVFGCGGDRDVGKRPMMGKIAGRICDVVLATSDNPRREEPEAILADIEKGLGESPLVRQNAKTLLRQTNGRGYDIITSRRVAIRAAIRYAGKNDVILISGKGHESYQIYRGGRIFFDDRLEALKNLGIINSPEPVWNLAQVMRATGGMFAGATSLTIADEHLRGISTDSRTIRPGDLFLALNGENYEGVKFAPQAVKKGAAAIVADRLPAEDSNGDGLLLGVPIILVNDPLKALGDLAAFRRNLLPKMPKIAITGSSGKTTVKEMTAAILGRRHNILKTEGNFNNLVGMPLTLLKASVNHELALLEMGMNHPGEIARLAEITDPDISCIVNVQEAHLAGLGDINGVARAKGELFYGTKPEGTLIVNLDDPQVRALAAQHSHNKITFAATPNGRRRGALIRGTHIKNTGEAGMAFTLHIGKQHRRVRLNSLGVHSVTNALAAAAMAHAAGISLSDIVAGLLSFSPVDKRAQVEILPNGIKILNDCYNANPSSMLTALKTLSAVRQDEKIIAVLGDMLELGEKGLSAHQEIGRAAADLGYDYLAAVGDYAGDLIKSAQTAGLSTKKAQAFTDKDALVNRLRQMLNTGELKTGDWLLIKGSRGMRMETIIDELKKGRP